MISVIQDYFNKVRTPKQARNLFPVTKDIIYLDSAHYSHYSLEARRRLVEAVDGFTYTNDNLSMINYQTAERVREKCAKLIHAKTKDVFISSNTTHGLNVFVNGIDLKAGDKVAFADSEFPAVVYPWLNLEKLKGIKCIYIPSDNGKIKLEDIEKTIKENDVKVLTISSVEFLGFRNDLKAIRKICTENNCLLVVDAIQNIGACPIYVDEIEMDFLSAGSQKWMMSPAGVGFAWINPKIKHRVSPTYLSTVNIKYDFTNFLDYKLDYVDSAVIYENSTLNVLGMIGLEAALELFLNIGLEKIFDHILSLQDVLIEGLEGSNFEIVSDLTPLHRSNILIFSHNDHSKNEGIQKALVEKKIFIALREGFLRLSPHLFNNEEEVKKLVEELNKF